jgi:hypothetical protein
LRQFLKSLKLKVKKYHEPLKRIFSGKVVSPGKPEGGKIVGRNQTDYPSLTLEDAEDMDHAVEGVLSLGSREIGAI